MKNNVYVWVIHKPTGLAYSLDRNYNCITNVTNLTADQIISIETLCLDHETEQGWHNLSMPHWAKHLPAKEFFAYWMF